MEFKKMEEIHETNYPTYEESKNTLWKLIMIRKNVGISVLCFYLLVNEAIATVSDYFAVSPRELGGSVVTASPEDIALIVTTLGAGVVLCIIVLIVIIVKIKRCIMKKVSDKKVDKNE